MGRKRTIEVFTAGCPLCIETLDMVKDCGCQVVERRCTETTCCDEATAYGVRSVPMIVADGVIVFEGKPSREQAIALLRR